VEVRTPLGQIRAHDLYADAPHKCVFSAFALVTFIWRSV
jgi:hypothetical protein